jgi:hypothetical protein
MGVYTTSDQKIQEAKDLIKGAYKLLLEASDEDTWGSSEFRDDYITTLHEVALELIKIKKKL